MGMFDYPVTIRRVVNGYIVSVGCMDFVFESLEELKYKLGEYFTAPEKAYEEWKEEHPDWFAERTIGPMQPAQPMTYGNGDFNMPPPQVWVR